MRKVNVAMAIALACTTPACTLVALGATSTTIRLHNLRVDDKEEWNYGWPLLISGVTGLVVDIIFFRFAEKMWSKPMN
jgi:hypothetical protein